MRRPETDGEAKGAGTGDGEGIASRTSVVLSRAEMENTHWWSRLDLRPGNEGQATLVDMNYFILGITEICPSGEQTVSFDFYFDLYWHDARLEGKSGNDVDWSNVWQPEVEITNALESSKEFENFMLEGSKVTYQTRFRTKLVATHMDLRNFPFDAQVLDISFESGAHDASEVKLQMSREAGCNVASSLVQPGGLAEWSFASLRELECVHELEFDASSYSNVTIHVVVARQYGFYIKKIMATVFLIVAMSWSVFFIEPSEVGDRIGISATLGLTAIAFSLVCSDALPRVSYLTVMDKYLTFSFVMIVFGVLENVIVYRLSLSSDDETSSWALTLDWVSLVVSILLTAISSVWFLCRGGWRSQADTNQDGILDASEVLAWQERTFGSVGSDTLTHGETVKRSHKWGAPPPSQKKVE